MPGSYCAIWKCRANSLKCSNLLTFHRLPRKRKNEEWRAALISKINCSHKLFNPERATICSRHFNENCFKYGPTGQRRLIPGSLPTEFMPPKSVETLKTPARREPQQSDDGSQPRQTVSGCDRMEEEEGTVKTEIKTERDTQEPPQCTTEQHSQEPAVKTEVKTERDTQEPPLVRLPVSQCMTEQHSEEPGVKTEVKIEIDVAEEPPLAWYMTQQHSQEPEVKIEIDVAEEPALAWYMTQQHSQEPEVKIEIDVAEEPALAWCMTQQHSHVSVEADFITESTASIKKEQTTKTQAEFFYQSLSSQESVKHHNRQGSEHIKSESRDAEDTTVVTGDTQFIPTHPDEGAGAESSAMARDDTTQLTRSPCNSESPSSQDGVSSEGSSTGLDHLTACQSNSLQGESFDKHMATQTENCTGQNKRAIAHTTPKKHSCTQCNASFSQPSALKRHMVAHTGERPYICAQCSASFCHLYSLKRHMHIHTGERPYRCAHCGAFLTCSTTFKRHMVIHTGERPYVCAQCSASFAERSTLKRHMVTHSGERPHVCVQCSASFRLPSRLKQHMRTHTTEKPFGCTQCSASFSWPSTLEQHMLTHTGERPYRCTQCSASFHHTTTLRQHMVTYTGGRPYVCAQCSACFGRPSILKRHMLTHTGERQFRSAWYQGSFEGGSVKKII